MQTYRVFNNITSMLAAFGFDANDRHLLARSYDAWRQYNNPADLCGQWDPTLDGSTRVTTILDTIEKMRATTIFVPPTVCYMMLEEGRINDVT